MVAPKATRATSFSLTTLPSALARRMTFSKSSGELKRPSAATVAVNAWPSGVGSPPTEPAANCRFWVPMALYTSRADRW
ncbi:hypothetical protein D3C71_1481970 [compost metagenome]